MEHYKKYSKDELNKIGNTIIYFSNNIGKLSKTKILKLLYILDELSIKKSGIPVLNLNFKTWKYGPVAEDIFIDLSSQLTLLKDYIVKDSVLENTYFKSAKDFNDDEFSQHDLDLMNYVVSEFGQKTASELIAYTHRVNSPWHNSASKNNVLEILESEEINNTEFIIDMSDLVKHDDRKLEMYNNYKEMN